MPLLELASDEIRALSDLRVQEKSAYDVAIDEKETLLAAARQTIEEKDCLLELAHQAVAERDCAVVERDNAIAERNSAVAERNSAMAERNVQRTIVTQTNDTLKHYKTHYFAAINQREELKIQLLHAQRQYQTIADSTVWRMTKPLRVILGPLRRFIVSHRAMYLFVKGVKSLLFNGFRCTWQKVRIYRQTRRHIQKQLAIPDISLDEQRNTKFPRDIKFSIVTPLYNTDETMLREMIASVQAQTYSNWELCLADGSDTKYAHVKNICTDYSKNDNRILYQKLPKNLGIAGNTIKAFDACSGEYIILLDHDDLLSEDALYQIMLALDSAVDVDFLFSDRAVFDDVSKKVIYQHLPGYNPDLLRSFNYASHLTAFSRAIINKVGFLRKGYDGSQDYDLELRVIEQARTILHIPKVLYYCRACEGSVAYDPDSKLYAYENGRKAIEAHLSRIGYIGTVEFVQDTYSYRIRYNIDNIEKVSIIIPNKDHIVDLRRCISSIINLTTYHNYEIIIVENSSINEETFEYYLEITSEYPKKLRVETVPNIKDFNYSEINNFATAQAEGEYLIFLNNDTEIITPNWIEEMLMFAQRPDVGAVGAKLYYPDGRIQNCGLIIGLGGHCAAHYNHKSMRTENGYMNCLRMVRNYSAVTAACMMVKKQDFIDVGGFDEVNFKVALNDIDLCLKFRSNNQLIVFTPYAELYHYEGATRGNDSDNLANTARYNKEAETFKEKWKIYFEGNDPYYYDDSL
jgi:GT2 family glycosyltransferase